MYSGIADLKPEFKSELDPLLQIRDMDAAASVRPAGGFNMNIADSLPPAGGFGMNTGESLRPAGGFSMNTSESLRPAGGLSLETPPTSTGKTLNFPNT